MIRIRIKKDGKSFFVPVPYSMINIGITIFSSNFIQKKINQKLNQDDKHKQISLPFSNLDKKQLKLVVREVKKYHGLEIVNVIDKEGSEITITL